MWRWVLVVSLAVSCFCDHVPLSYTVGDVNITLHETATSAKFVKGPVVDSKGDIYLLLSVGRDESGYGQMMKYNGTTGNRLWSRDLVFGLENTCYPFDSYNYFMLDLTEEVIISQIECQNGYFGSYFPFALDAATGRILWRFSLGPSNQWLSPAAAITNGTSSFIVAQFSNPEITAVDAKTGVQLWKTNPQGARHNYIYLIDPLYFHYNDSAAVIFVDLTCNIYSLDPNSGALLWNVTNTKFLYNGVPVIGAGLTEKWGRTLWNQRLVILSSETELFAYDVFTGDVEWSAALQQGFHHYPTSGLLVGESSVYVPLISPKDHAFTTHVAAYDIEDGSLLWTSDRVGGGQWVNTMGITYDDQGNQLVMVYGYNPHGSEGVWWFALDPTSGTVISTAGFHATSGTVQPPFVNRKEHSGLTTIGYKNNVYTVYMLSPQ